MSPDESTQMACGSTDCSQCCIRRMTLVADPDASLFAKIQLFITPVEFAQGDVLYDEGRAVNGMFSMRAGMVKLVRSTRDGRQRIVRVQRPGDLVGIEALAATQYSSEAVALTPVSACHIPLGVVQELLRSGPYVLSELLQKWQQTLRDADDGLAELNFGTARQRVGNLVLKMRSPDNDGVATLFSREDMGAMLDLKFETVSREVSRLVREGAIEPLDRMGRNYRVCKPDEIQCL